MEATGLVWVFGFALLTSVATGLGTAPVAVVRGASRRWLGAANVVAAMVALRVPIR